MGIKQRQNNFKFFFTGFVILFFLAFNGLLYKQQSQYSNLFITAQNLCSELIRTLVAPQALNTPQQIASDHVMLQKTLQDLAALDVLKTPGKDIYTNWEDRVSPALLATLNNKSEQEDIPALLLITHLQTDLQKAYKQAYSTTHQRSRLMSSTVLALLLVLFVYLYISRDKTTTDNPTLLIGQDNQHPLPEDSTLLHRTLPKLIENPESLEPLKTLLSEIEKTIDASSSAVFLYDKNNPLPNLLVCTFFDEQDLYLSSTDDFPHSFVRLKSQHHSIYLATYQHSYKMVGIHLPYDSENNANALLLLKVSSNTELNDNHTRLLTDHAELLASMIHISQFFKHKLRNVQYEERATIARELHDSIAQSLSYLKIQASRLQSLVNSDKTSPSSSLVQIDLSVQELRESISIAYRHLRELLTTFRLTMDGNSFARAIEDSIKEFEKRCSIAFELDNRLPDGELSVAEEMQLLHIMREALSNIVRHSHGQYAKVTLLRDQDDKVKLSVEDDGIGLGSAGDRENHHGLIIMQERTRSIGGTLEMEDREPQGTRVLVTFQSVKNNKNINA